MIRAVSFDLGGALLTRLRRDYDGRRVVHDGANETSRELKDRGYRLGIIANLIGENERRLAAGLGMTVGVRYPDKKPQAVTDANRPDVFIRHFSELPDIFPH